MTLKNFIRKKGKIFYQNTLQETLGMLRCLSGVNAFATELNDLSQYSGLKHLWKKSSDFCISLLWHSHTPTLY